VRTGLHPTEPRSLRSADERRRRRAMLDLPHIAPLRLYAAKLRAEGRGLVPEFNPMDGGTMARALFLLEKPGPMTDETKSGLRVGSGFISRDNDDPSAEATFRFTEAARIPRSRVVLWNLVPWWNGSRKVTSAELRDGATALSGLIALLPDLRAVVLVGRKASRAAPLIGNRGLSVCTSAHPSPIVRASRPDIWRAIPDQWARIASLIG
jgi:uracil DNA glycosylase superfamily protein